jgi:hypothetical protein
MRYAYLMIGTGVILVGLYEIVSGLSHRGRLFSGWGPGRAGDRLHGCTQVLNSVYGCAARGVRGAALGANVALLVVGWAAGNKPSGFEWVPVGLVGLAALLSLSPKSLRPS